MDFCGMIRRDFRAVSPVYNKKMLYGVISEKRFITLLCFLALLFIFTFPGCTRYPEHTSFTYDFERGIRGWKQFGCMTVSHEMRIHHTGMASLKMEGILPAGLWSFTESKKIRIRPGARYTFSGWMRIDSISENSSLFKCALWSPEKWIRNVDSTWYDMSRRGQWQQLTAEFEAPAEEELLLSFFVEKRPAEKEVSATIYIDDLAIRTIY